jgi:hypothetical protein
MSYNVTNFSSVTNFLGDFTLNDFLMAFFRLENQRAGVPRYLQGRKTVGTCIFWKVGPSRFLRVGRGF